MKWKALLSCLMWCGVVPVTAAQNTVAAPVAPAALRLTLSEAIQRGLKANISILLAGSGVQEAEGTRQRRMAAALLPRVNAETYASFQNRNLRAFGLSFPSVPTMVGPFSNYDIHLYAQQNVLDLSAYRNYHASQIALESAKLDESDARDMIVQAVAAVYLNAESAAARVDAAQSRVTEATALYQLAQDKHDTGTATGVDVLRAQVQLANDRQSLLIAKNEYQQTLLELARALGMRPGSPIELAESLAFHPLQEASAPTLVDAALAARADYRSLVSQRQAIVTQQAANRARSYPRLSVSGNYGGIGRSVGGIEQTGLIQGQIDVTLFDRDRNGEALELAARMRAVDERIADLRRGIEEEIRSALLNLDSARQQVDVAGQGQDLAHRELAMARDRFEQGTANNIEVITAQDELARAEENYILAVSSYVNGTYSLARALGDTEKNMLELSKH